MIYCNFYYENDMYKIRYDVKFFLAIYESLFDLVFLYLDLNKSILSTKHFIFVRVAF